MGENNNEGNNINNMDDRDALGNRYPIEINTTALAGGGNGLGKLNTTYCANGGKGENCQDRGQDRN